MHRVPNAARPVVAVLLALLAVLPLAGCGDALPRGTATYSGGSSVAATGTPTAALAPATPVSGLVTMTVAQLPPEGVATLRLIAQGGPYPYSQDGAVFGNREGLLPAHPAGWYKEYTVVTPGSNDRGARRIVAGADGGRFYTSDHYASFREVLSGESS
ncbi:MAG TPA: ribonuclease domain-containing protein [Candidatus Angelobacter sp.]|nr:ribonuclease domain-containing protein [Candidatus Angelobacter sp.]